MPSRRARTVSRTIYWPVLDAHKSELWPFRLKQDLPPLLAVKKSEQPLI
jgi:hypothetical protein